MDPSIHKKTKKVELIPYCATRWGSWEAVLERMLILKLVSLYLIVIVRNSWCYRSLLITLSRRPMHHPTSRMSLAAIAAMILLPSPSPNGPTYPVSTRSWRYENVSILADSIYLHLAEIGDTRGSPVIRRDLNYKVCGESIGRHLTLSSE